MNWRVFTLLAAALILALSSQRDSWQSERAATRHARLSTSQLGLRSDRTRTAIEQPEKETPALGSEHEAEAQLEELKGTIEKSDEGTAGVLQQDAGAAQQAATVPSPSPSPSPSPAAPPPPPPKRVRALHSLSLSLSAYMLSCRMCCYEGYHAICLLRNTFFFLQASGGTARPRQCWLR